MDGVIQISKINDFLFCPHSIYLHGIYESFHESIYHQDPQHKGKIVHEAIENGTYSSALRYMQGTAVYCQKYNLTGKIDIYDTQEKSLIERKYKIKKIYDGHKYQLYAQMFALIEMGYEVKNLYIHSLSDNKRYSIPCPEESEVAKFDHTIAAIRAHTIDTEISVNPKKCAMCIYRQLCHKSLC